MRIRCLQALAYGQLAGAAYLQPRSDGGHGGQQKRIGLDGIAELNVRAEYLLYSAHTRLQGIHIKDKGRRAVGGRKLLQNGICHFRAPFLVSAASAVRSILPFLFIGSSSSCRAVFGCIKGGRAALSAASRAAFSQLPV